MRKKKLLCGILVCMALGMCACSGKDEEKSSNVSASAVSGDETKKPVPSGGTESEPKKTEKDADNGTVFVGIKAHVKEINGNEILISSDSDDYPGVFLVTEVEDMPEFSDLQGGTSLLILMQETGEKDGQGIDRCRAEKITVLSGVEEEVQEDIFLTDAPTFVLQDVLSSKMDAIELRSGNYSWNVEENGAGTGGIACGTAPLEEAAMDFTVKLKLPEYNSMDSVLYTFSTKVTPDTLTVSMWDISDMGNNEAKEERIIRYYYKAPLLELEKGKVYEFTAVWKKKNTAENQFYGNASYVMVTE